jgi:hypothetical protein
MARVNACPSELVAGRIAGLRLARQNQVNVRVRPTEVAIDESVDLAHEIFNRVFRKTYKRLGTSCGS